VWDQSNDHWFISTGAALWVAWRQDAAYFTYVKDHVRESSYDNFSRTVSRGEEMIVHLQGTRQTLLSAPSPEVASAPTPPPPHSAVRLVVYDSAPVSVALSTPEFIINDSNSHVAPDESLDGSVFNESKRDNILVPDTLLCVVCLDRNRTHAIVPCGHLCACISCVNLLNRCPCCNGPKTMAIKIYNP
jgi:hypothetical protein